MDALTRHLSAALAQAPPGPLAVAFSGGGDSAALLHALAGLARTAGRRLRALHVDHGLNPASRDWAEACARFCEGLGVPLARLRVQVDADAGNGLEAAAREARYRALTAEMETGELLLTAHHQRDQAETLLLRALRGSGPQGLGAMRPLRRFGPGWLWRPLLDLPAEAIEAHLTHHDLPRIEDPANRDLRHDRSWLRQELLPLLRSRWPTADAALALSARLSAEAAEGLDAADAARLAELRGLAPATLDATGLSRLPAPTRARLLRLWLRELGLPPLPHGAHAEIDRCLLHSRHDAEPAYDWPGGRLSRWRGLLHATGPSPPLPSLDATWDGHRAFALPGGGCLRLEPPKGALPPLRLRLDWRRGGETLRLPGRRHTHALKKLLQQLGVPPWERARLPLLFATDGALEAAGDLLLSARFDATLRERGQRLRWLPDGHDAPA